MPEGRDAKDSSPTGSATKDVNTFIFTDCFITSYTAAASLGQIPTVNVSYTAENIQYQLGGSGIVPCLDPKTREPKNDIAFLLPKFSGENMPTVLTPGDISVEILSTGYGPSEDDIKDLGIKFSDHKIQSYNLRMDFEREPLRSLGYKGIIDRPINFPIFANLSFETVVGELETGSLINLHNAPTAWEISGLVATAINIKAPTMLLYGCCSCITRTASHSSPVDGLIALHSLTFGSAGILIGLQSVMPNLSKISSTDNNVSVNY